MLVPPWLFAAPPAATVAVTGHVKSPTRATLTPLDAPPPPPPELLPDPPPPPPPMHSTMTMASSVAQEGRATDWVVVMMVLSTPPETAAVPSAFSLPAAASWTSR